MKKKSFSILIVVGIIVFTPLIGYFGTKFLVLKMKESTPGIESGVEALEPVDSQDPATTPPETVADAEPSETTPPGDATSSVQTRVTLPQQNVIMVQLASLSSLEGARSFISDRSLEALIFEKDGLYKVVHGIFKDDSGMAPILMTAREVVSEAFKTTGELRSIEVSVSGIDEAQAGMMVEDLKVYFTLLKKMDDYYGALLEKEPVQELSEDLVKGLKPLLDREYPQGELALGLKQIYQETEALVSGA
ncbi:MAG: hypothetical protein AVO33_08530, partial [delta proteobacterium ML8_F1]